MFSFQMVWQFISLWRIFSIWIPDNFMFVGRSIQTVASIKRIPLVFEYRTILCSVFKWFEFANWIATVLIQISNPVSLLSIAQGKKNGSTYIRPASTGLNRQDLAMGNWSWLPILGKELVGPKRSRNSLVTSRSPRMIRLASTGLARTGWSGGQGTGMIRS